jgi:hypothetical protein
MDVFEQARQEAAKVALEDAVFRLRANDPLLVRLDRHHIRAHGFGPHLSEALRHNTHVSFRQLTIHEFYSGRELAGSHHSLADGFLRFLQNSNSLEGAELTCYFMDDNQFYRHMGWILEALADSPRLRMLKLSQLVLDGNRSALIHLLRRTQSLQSLSLNCEIENGPLDLQSLGAAVASNTTLLKLVIEVTNRLGPSKSWIVEPILSQLHLHPTLTDLVLHCWGYIPDLSHVQDLSFYISSPETRLRRLKLINFQFDAEKMQALVQGLSANQSIEGLWFAFCQCDEAATQLFVDYMKAPKPTINVTAVAVAVTAYTGLRHLTIEESIAYDMVMFSPSTNNHPAQLSLPQALVAMCSGPAVNNSSGNNDTMENDGDIDIRPGSIGSRLQSLTVDGRGMPRDYERFQQPSFWTPFFESTLPSMGHLKSLTIFGVHFHALWQSARGGRLIEEGIQKNGSLEHVQICLQHGEDDEDYRRGPPREPEQPSPLLSPALQRRIQAYCDRNKHLPALLAVPKLDDFDMHVVDEENEVSSRTDVAMFTTLYASSRQAPRTAASNTLIGLLAVGTSNDSISD